MKRCPKCEQGYSNRSERCESCDVRLVYCDKYTDKRDLQSKKKALQEQKRLKNGQVSGMVEPGGRAQQGLRSTKEKMYNFMLRRSA